MNSVATGKSIAVLYPYFGEFPWYFSYFLHSCRHNPGINFFIISDTECPFPLPPNVCLINRSLAEVKAMSEDVLGFEINVEPQPFKFCDLRPAFGLIFRQYIKDYDFWGHGDTDVIFGDVRNFISDELLQNYDLVCSRPDYISSWFTLYRNTDRMNNLFRLSKDYRKVFTTQGYYNFDEVNFRFLEFSEGFPYDRIESEIESMTHLVKRLNDEGYINAYFDLHAIEGRPGHTKWQSGKLVYKNRYELMLYHLLELKKVYKPKALPAIIPDRFYISPTRIYF